MSSLLDIYQQHVHQNKIVSDPLQIKIIEQLALLGEKLIARHNASSLFTTLGRLCLKRPQLPVKGLYLWGGVGRGKTYLMDLFFEHLKLQKKTRLHFHRFMNELHESLTQMKGIKDPLKRLAHQWSQHTVCLCFDEFFVSDIADAMLLGEFFQALFTRGVTLVATSNIPPERLYENGLQRTRFLPAIEAILEHTQVIHLDTHVDYRMRVLEQAEIYHCPLDRQAEDNLCQYFEQLAPEPGKKGVRLNLKGHEIVSFKCADSVVWFKFDDLCDAPRGTQDYIEIARMFHTVILSQVTKMSRDREDVARRFIALVDELYERNVTLIISAQVPIESLYQGEKLCFEFERTISRLTEMRTKKYLGQAHCP